MKNVLAKVFSLLRSFFVSLKIHIHVGFRTGDSSKDNERNTTNEESDDPDFK